MCWAGWYNPLFQESGTLQLSHITTENNPFSFQPVADFAPQSAALIAIKLNAVFEVEMGNYMIQRLPDYT